MRNIKLLTLGLAFLVGACTPRIYTKIDKSYAPLDAKADVKVIGILDQVPGNTEVLGTVSVRNTGFSSDCGYDSVLNKAKLAARKVGGNAIKILVNIPPSSLGNQCNEITARILKVSDFNALPVMTKVDSILSKADYALLHIYRPNGPGFLVGYDIHLGDTVICRAKNNWRKTIRIKRDGLNTIWAKTEVKEELPVNIKIGKEYYIRCWITSGIVVGRPKIVLVSRELGKEEYAAIHLNNSDFSDKLFLIDGRVIDCQIQNEDSENIYYNFLKNDNQIKTWISKSLIKDIQRGE